MICSQTHPAVITIRGDLVSFGDANPDKFFYIIPTPTWRTGFFTYVFNVFGHLAVTEQLGMIPVVDMQNHMTSYTERELVNGTANVWEYYFAPLSPYSLDEVYSSKNVFKANVFLRRNIDTHLDVASRLFEKYIHVRPEVQSAVQSFADEHFSGKTILGVHFRGQEMKTAQRHPHPPSPGQMVRQISSFLEKYPIDRVFVVSEDQGYVDMLRQYFGDKIITLDCFRTYDGVNAYHIRPYPRPLHMYLLGYEVLCNALLLSQTDYFIAGGHEGESGHIADGSNVSLFAQAINNGRFKDVFCIYNGRNLPDMPSNGKPAPPLPIWKRAVNKATRIITGKNVP